MNITPYTKIDVYKRQIMGNKTSKTLVLERHNYEGFHDLTDDMKRKSIRAVFYSSIFWPILIVVSYTLSLIHI